MKKAKTFCEYCGRSDHATKKSKKCKAPEEPHKKYRKLDGSLLTTEPNDDAVLLDPSDVHLVDCHDMDGMTFNADYDASNDDNLVLMIEGIGSETNNNNTEGITRATI
jgi:hypothetical protein